jgi:hypothetical protein
MRWVVGIGLSLTLCFALAESASSGAIGDPFTPGACADIDVSGDAMSDPNDAFSGAPSLEACEKLCDKAARQCRSYVKDGVTCLNRYSKQSRGWDDANCEIIYDDDPDSRRMCKESAKNQHEFEKELIAAFRDEALSDCDDWGTTCSQSCIVF